MTDIYSVSEKRGGCTIPVTADYLHNRHVSRIQDHLVEKDSFFMMTIIYFVAYLGIFLPQDSYQNNLKNITIMLSFLKTVSE